MTVRSPRDLETALEQLAANPNARVLAGGTDLMVEFETGRTTADSVLDIWALDELRGITEDDAGVSIGALTSCSELCRDARVVDILRAAAFEVGAEQIRNRATIGGNLGTASPAADLTPVLFALEATVCLVSRDGRRTVPVDQFVTGYRSTTRNPDELIESIHIPTRPADERRKFRKVGTRRAQSISKLVVAFAIRGTDPISHAASGAGSIGPGTMRLAAFERALVGRPWNDQTIEAAARAAAVTDATPIDDVRSTERYRRETLYRVLRSLLRSAAADCAPNGT